MYRYYVPKRAPVAFWLLDDSVPFQEHSGVAASGDKKSGTSDPTVSVPLVSGAEFSSVFDAGAIGQFQCNVFKQGLESRPFVLEAWILPIPKTTTGQQQILSHDGAFDGLSIEGKVIKFSTEYGVEGEASCEFDLGEYKMAHVVGIHNSDQNQLWVNGELVSSVDITDAQKADSYITTDEYLYCGYTTSNQELAVNAVAFYASLSGDQIVNNYLAGIESRGQARVYPQYGGYTFGINSDNGSVFIKELWDSKEEFNRGLKNNVEYSESRIVTAYSSGLSLAGDWTVSLPLDSQGDTSIYGVMVSWSGVGITLDVSLDGTSWSPATSGELVSLISAGSDPTGKDLQIRVNFAGGLSDDTSYLDSLIAIGFRNNEINNITTRVVTVSHPAVVRDDYEPNLFRDDNGASLHGGTLTIGVDATTDPDVARTLELWIKPISGTPSISVGGTKYRNGFTDTSLPVGEWSLIHYVSASDISSSITISGECIVGQATLYPTALSAGNVESIFRSYTGSDAFRIVDNNDIEISEGPSPAYIYGHDWSIDAAG